MIQAGTIMIGFNIPTYYYCLHPRQRSESGQKSSHKDQEDQLIPSKTKILQLNTRHMAQHPEHRTVSFFPHVLNVTTQLVL